MDDASTAGPPEAPSLTALRGAMDAGAEPRLLIDSSETIRIVNQAACALLGQPESDVVGQRLEALIPSGTGLEDTERSTGWAVAREAVRETRRLPLLAGLRVVRADEFEVPVEVAVTPVITDQGTMAILVLHDTTDAPGEARLFRALMDSGPDAVVVVDAAGTVRMISDAAERCFGYDRAELVGLRLDALVPPRFRRRHRQLTEELWDHPRGRPMGHVGTLYAQHKDGHEFPVDISLTPVATAEGPLVIAAVRDLTERLAAMAAMRRVEEQKLVLEETNRAKDQFLATVSHELRTPLASILGYCELITDRDDLTGEVAHFMSVIMRNVRRETKLVEDLLMLVHINEGGAVTARRESADFAGLVRHAVESAQPQADVAHVTAVVDRIPETLAVVCDADRISQVVDCLLSNAMKFTLPGGEIHVSVWADATTAWCVVRDTGVGIGDAEPQRVFERLYRSPTAVARQIPGAGLGLSIAAAIVAAHGGSIEVLDTGERGTTFRFGLPVGGRPRRGRRGASKSA